MTAERPLIAMEAEYGVIGAMMRDAELVETIGAMLSPTDFSDPDVAELYTLILAARSAGRPVDPVSLSDMRHTMTSGEMTVVYAAQIMRNVPSAANGPEYARIVAERSKARQIAAVGNMITELASKRLPLPEIISQAQNAVLALNSESDEPDVITLGQALGDVVDEMDRRFNGQGVNGLKTGLRDLDNILKGLRPQNVIIIGGRPGTGKTTLGIGIAEYLAICEQKSALIFSLEMSGKELSKRSLASASEVSTDEIDTGDALKADDKIDRIKGAVWKLKNADIRICEKGGLPLSRIRNIARFQHRAKPLDLIVIDYISMIRSEPGAHHQNRNYELGAISRGIKEMAKELDVPILVLAQLNRAIEGRANKSPQMSDLRDSGEIEQDADVIIMAHRDPDSDHGRSGLTELNIVKHRHAATGNCVVQHQGQFSRFVNFAGQYEQQEQAKKKPTSTRSLINSFHPSGRAD